MILWVMPDTGAKTKANYQKLVERFQKEYPKAQVQVQVLTRNILWKKIFMMRNPAAGETIPDLLQIPHYWTALTFNFSSSSFSNAASTPHMDAVVPQNLASPVTGS